MKGYYFKYNKVLHRIMSEPISMLDHQGVSYIAVVVRDEDTHVIKSFDLECIGRIEKNPMWAERK